MRPRLAYLTPLLLLAAGCGDHEHTVQTRTQLVQYSSCSALEHDLESMMIQEIDAQIDGYGRWGWGEDDSAGGEPAPESGDDGREEGVDYSGTNNQEDGVDEADFVKTDGYHVYVLNGNRVHVFGVPEFGDLVPESVTEIEGHPTQMLLDKEDARAVVFSIVPVYDLPEDHPLREHLGELDADGNWIWRTWNVTKITVLDVSDPTAPALVREVFVEGWYQTARRNGTSVRVASYTWINNPILWNWWSIYQQYEDEDEAKLAIHAAIRALPLEELVPRYYVRTPDGALAPNELTVASCSQFYAPTNSHAYGTTSLYSLDLAADDLAIDADNVVSNWPTLYASDDTLVLAEPANSWWWFWDPENLDDPEQLNVHMFDISTPGRSDYIASGRVEGHLWDQFSINEEDGFLRLATTDNRWSRWWDETPEPVTNHIWVLEQDGSELVTAGHLGGIAPDETIYAARFVGDRAFLVTFQQIDPLFTIDMRNPRHPQLVGELQVPGFSTYLQQVRGDRVLAIGVGGDEDGASWGQTQVSLFDVGDFEHPALQSKLALQVEGDWSWSEAQWDHHAFQYWAPKNLLAIPMSTYQQVGDYDWRYLSRLELINVDLDGQLTVKGSIDHTDLYSTDEYWYYRDIRRSIFMGDFIYAISDRGVSVHRADSLQLVTLEQLPGYSPDDWYWWW